MVKEFKYLISLGIIFSLFFTFGCSKMTNDEKFDPTNIAINATPSEINSKEKVEVEIWSWFTLGEGIYKQFEKENPGITIKEKLFKFEECNQEYMKALADGTGPDIFMFDSSYFGQYTVDEILQNLLEEPYNAGKYENKFLGWKSGFSFDNKQLLSITFNAAPVITFYREDIMKENGFPSEPEEFGKFIEDPDNLIAIGKKLKTQDKYIFQYPTDLSDITGSALGYFDENLMYCRVGELFGKSIDVAKKANDNNLVFNNSFWHDVGKKAIQENRLVMMPLGSYAMNTLQSYAPEQAGKWRVTKAPLGVSALASDSRMGINMQSERKYEAWSVMEYILTHSSEMRDVVPGYISASNAESIVRSEAFFGNQKVYPLIEETAKKMVYGRFTPLDDKAYEMYITGIWKSLQTNESVDEKMLAIKNKVDEELADERKSLLESINP